MIDGTIYNYTMHPANDGFIVHGQIKGDRKGRFADGEYIYTSRVLGIDESNRCVTRNSTYQLEGMNHAV